jgi:membrane protein DedA with SNARE-associated domain
MEALLAQLIGLESWQIALFATVLLLEGAVLAIVPEEGVGITLGILWALGKIDFWFALLAMQIGLLPANQVAVEIGRRFGPKIFRNRYVRCLFSEESVARATLNFRRWGFWVVFLTRFTPLIRGPVYLSAGLLGVSRLRFLLVDTLASFLQIPLLLWLGRSLGQRAPELIKAYQDDLLLFLALIAGGVGLKWMGKLVSKHPVRLPGIKKSTLH